jgi:hypothetical protein
MTDPQNSVGASPGPASPASTAPAAAASIPAPAPASSQAPAPQTHQGELTPSEDSTPGQVAANCPTADEVIRHSEWAAPSKRLPDID